MPITLSPGDPAPRFITPARHTSKFHFDSVGGRYVALSFIGGASQPGMLALLHAVVASSDVFDNAHAAFFAVSHDPRDRDNQSGQIPDHPSLHLFWDFGGDIGRAYGVLGEPEGPGMPAKLAPATFVFDPALRLLAVLPIDDPERHGQRLRSFIGGLPKLADQGRSAPILILPRVLEPDFCRRMIAYYESAGGEESGFMREEKGKTVGVMDYKMKRRRDCNIEDESLKAEFRARIERRLVPEIQRSFSFRATRIERYIVACYDAGEGGYFRPHRDNTTKGTAHRRFAVTINLNAQDYEGGDLRFPEFGPQTYRAPTGGAVVFGCSLLHEATPVTRGRRYCTLPFLYDEAAHELRQQNLKFLDSETVLDLRKAGGGAA